MPRACHSLPARRERRRGRRVAHSAVAELYNLDNVAEPPNLDIVAASLTHRRLSHLRRRVGRATTTRSDRDEEEVGPWHRSAGDDSSPVPWGPRLPAVSRQPRARAGRYVSEAESRPVRLAKRADPGDLASPTALIKIVVAQASFIAALMFYVGVIYTGAYYDYFHLSPFTLRFGFAEFVLQSLHLMTFPVLVGAVVVLIALALSGRRPRQALPGGVVRGASVGTSVLARYYLVVVAAGLILLVLWWRWQLFLPYRWVGPLLIAIGLLLGEARQTDGDRPPRGWRDTAVPVFAAGMFLLWTLTLAAGQLGELNARNDARDVITRTGLVVFSAERLGLRSSSPALRFDDLRKGVHLRYRYSGLRLIVARNEHYYAVPIGWKAETDPVFVFQEADNMRIELMPGVR